MGNSSMRVLVLGALLVGCGGADNHDIDIVLAILGGGTVTDAVNGRSVNPPCMSTPTAIDLCSAQDVETDCRLSYDSSIYSVDLTATPNPGWIFDSWKCTSLLTDTSRSTPRISLGKTLSG